MPTVRQQRALGRADQDLAQTMQSFWYCYELSLPPWPCATACASASRPTTSRGHRRVQRAATVALPRLFWFCLLLQTRGPRHPHYKRRLCVLGRFGRGGWLFEVLGFEATYQTRTCHPPPSPSPGRQSQIVHQELHCTRQRRNRRGTSRVVSTTLHDRKNASAATRGNKSCILRPRESGSNTGAARMQSDAIPVPQHNPRRAQA